MKNDIQKLLLCRAQKDYSAAVCDCALHSLSIDISALWHEIAMFRCFGLRRVMIGRSNERRWLAARLRRGKEIRHVAGMAASHQRLGRAAHRLSPLRSPVAEFGAYAGYVGGSRLS